MSQFLLQNGAVWVMGLVHFGIWDWCIVGYWILPIVERFRLARRESHCISHAIALYIYLVYRAASPSSLSPRIIIWAMTNCFFFCSIFLFHFFLKPPCHNAPGGTATANTNCSHNLPKINTTHHLYVPDQLRLIMWPNTMEMCSLITLYFLLVTPAVTVRMGTHIMSW